MIIGLASISVWLLKGSKYIFCVITFILSINFSVLPHTDIFIWKVGFLWTQGQKDHVRTDLCFPIEGTATQNLPAWLYSLLEGKLTFRESLVRNVACTKQDSRTNFCCFANSCQWQVYTFHLPFKNVGFFVLKQVVDPCSLYSFVTLLCHKKIHLKAILSGK